jgi:hypothetical protein
VVGDGEISFGGGQDVSQLFNTLEGAAVNAATGKSNTNGAAQAAAPAAAAPATTTPAATPAAAQGATAAAAVEETTAVAANPTTDSILSEQGKTPTSTCSFQSLTPSQLLPSLHCREWARRSLPE